VASWIALEMIGFARFCLKLSVKYWLGMIRDSLIMLLILIFSERATNIGFS